jgi:hypothetical protein
MNELEIKSAITGALASRGKNKGQLKAKCPPMNTPEAAAWLAIMSHVNPYKVGFGQMLFMDSGNRAIFDAIDRAMNKMGKEQYIGLDKDRLALESLGVW